MHFAFNLLWSAAYFGRQSVLLGLVVIVVMWLLIVVPTWRSTGWVTFAAFLNYRIWVLN